MNKNDLILIIGAGSIGERHIRNLWKMGYHNLMVYRQRNLPFRDIDDSKVIVVNDWEIAMNAGAKIAFICTPSNQHLNQCIYCLQNGMHVLVEKPLSHTIEQFDMLIQTVQSKNKMLQVAFMMRFHPHIITIKKMITELTFGKLLKTESHWGSFLPDWHPYEDYKESYAAKKSMGGGVALTLCHDIDLALWLSGSELKKFKSVLVDSDILQIDAESIADIHLFFENGVQSHVHLNYLDSPPIRWYKWKFEKAEVEFTYLDNTLTIIDENQTVSNHQLNNFERNDLYIREVESFLNVLEKNQQFTDLAIEQITTSKQIINICNG